MLTYLNFILLFCYHTFYVSLCEVRFVEDKSMIEVSWKFFPDDIEEAIRPLGAESFYLDHRNFNTDSLLTSYLSSNFICSQNGVQLQDEFIGYEIDGGDLWCYFQIPYDNDKSQSEPLSLVVSSLTEVFPEQQNYVHVYHDDRLINSQMLTLTQSRILLDFK